MESRGEGNNKEASRFSCLMYDYDYELSQIGWLTTSSTSPISAIFRRRSLSSALKSCSSKTARTSNIYCAYIRAGGEVSCYHQLAPKKKKNNNNKNKFI
jgi:hypothetical protein